MRALVATAIAVGVVAGVLLAGGRDAQPAAGLRDAAPSSQDVGVRWIRLRIPASWSVRGATGGTVVATPIAPGWSRAVSLTAAPFELAHDLGHHESSPSIPAGSYQLWISGSRQSRRGTRAGAAPLSVHSGDRVVPPPPGVGIQFARTGEIGDRVITAVVRMDRKADVDAALAEANRILRTLRMVE
jgi:hypothetical protein